MTKWQFTLILITLLLSVSSVKSKKISRNIINGQTSPTITSYLTEANNDPWYADFGLPNRCDTIAYADASLNGIEVVSVDFKGGVGSSTCFSITNSFGTFNYAFKIASMSLVHDFNLEMWCGSMTTLETRKDSVKTSISNGFSCHCPLGLTDAKFGPCEADTIPNLGTEFYRGIPMSGGAAVTNFTLCHTSQRRGPATGCDIASDGDTDYYMKFYTNWRMSPTFRLKPRDILEIKIGLYTFDTGLENFRYVGNFSLSDLSQDNYNKDNSSDKFQNFGYVMSSSQPVDSLMGDYVFVADLNNFTDPEKIYAIHTREFNALSEFDPMKLCPIKQVYSEKVEMQKWQITDLISQLPDLVQCSPAIGVYNTPMPRLPQFMSAANKLSNRLNINNVDFLPGETALLKESVKTAVNMKLLYFDGIANFTYLQSQCFVNKFHFTCDPAINDEGFKCILLVDLTVYYTEKCKVNILAKDSSTVITEVSGSTGENTFQTFINPIYTSENKVTLCASATNLPPICVTNQLKDNITNDIIDNPVINANNNTDNGQGGNVFTTHSGKWHPWLIGVVTTVSAIIFILIIIYLLPFFMTIASFFHKAFKNGVTKIHEYRQKLAKKAPDVETAPETNPLSEFRRTVNSQGDW